MDDLSNNADVTEPADGAFGVEMNRDIPLGDGERAIAVLYALQKESESSVDSGSVEYLAPELTAQIDSFSMYDVVVETLHRLQKENVCPAVPITPETRLEELFPTKGREKNWNRFIQELQYQDWETGRAAVLTSKIEHSIIRVFLLLFLSSIPIGILNYCYVIDYFPDWLKMTYLSICLLLCFLICLIYLLMNFIPFHLFKKSFNSNINTVEELSYFLKEINLYRISDPDSEWLANSDCPILKKILSVTSQKSTIPELQLNLQTRLNSLFQGNKAYLFWDELIKELKKATLNLPYRIPYHLSTRSKIVQWMALSIGCFIVAAMFTVLPYTLIIDPLLKSDSNVHLIDKLAPLSTFVTAFFFLYFGFLIVQFIIALVMVFISTFDYFLFPRYDFPVRYQTVGNLVNRFRAANAEWLAKNSPESLDAKLRTLAFPNEEQKAVIERLKSEQEKEEEDLEDF